MSTFRATLPKLTEPGYRKIKVPKFKFTLKKFHAKKMKIPKFYGARKVKGKWTIKSS